MSDAAAPDNRELLKRALRKLDELQSKLDAMEATQREPIAIVGLGCRFPRGGNDPTAFWRNLREGVDGITEVPPDRWDVDAFYDPEPGVPGKMYVRHAGFLDQVDGFDPHFFGIAPREAPGTDPQQRLLLEIVWEALEDAGQAPDRLEGSPTGVFVGIGSFDYSQLQTRSGGTDLIDAYSASGMSHSVAAGRISYLLGLAGPAVAVDTACSSSLVAVHLACQSLRTGECEIALAGGVNLILSPDGSIATCQARMLAPDGHCKTFDGSADGYVRSEGCGIVVLKRLSAAIANRDHIRAVIRGTAINQDGRSSGLTAPNGPAQEAVIRQALERSGVEGSEITYVEAHGTGTSLGDPIELRALGAVLGPGRAADRPLGVGSVKTNIGHLEAAAGVAGLVKMVLALENEEIPPHLHFRTPNPHVPWNGLPLEVVTEPRPFPRDERPRLVGVSAFGFSGTNAHLVLEEAPPVAEAAAEVDRPQHLLCLSARDERVFRAQIASFERHLDLDPEVPWTNVCFTANAGRSHLEERLAVRAANSEEGRSKLAGVIGGDELAPGIWRGRTEAGPPEIAFLFTGQGSQYVGMGRQLYETQPTFRGALERCAGVLEGDLERPLLEVLFGDSEESSVLDQTGYTQPALFALEYALAELLRAWGIEPTIVLGHSVGEYVAACVAGVMGLEDGLRLIARRGRLMQSLPSGGAMTALEAPEERVREALRGHEGEVSVAAVNAPDSVVISGVAEVVSEVSRVLEAEGVRAQPLKVSHAFHSPLIEPILSDLESAAGEVEYGEARLGIVSNLSGKLAGPGDLARPGYWRRQAREAVRFAASIETLGEEGIGAYVEVGPHPTLLGLGQRQVTDGRSSWHPTLRRGQEDWPTLLDAVGGLYVRGVEVDWEGFDRDYRRRRVSLPTYPFERRRYWLESASRGARNARVHGGGGGVVVHPLLGARVRSPLSVISYEAELASGSPKYLSDHAFYGRVVFPAAGYAELGLVASREAFGEGAVRVEELEIEEPLLLESEDGVLVQTLLTPEEGSRARFEVFSALASEEEPTWRRHVRGRVGGGDGAGPSGEDSPVVSARERCGEEIPVERYYEEFREHGVEYGPGFRWLHRVWRGADEAVGELRRPEGAEGGVGGYLVHPGLLDGGIQLLGAALAGRGDSDSAYMPVRLSGLRWHSSSPTVSLAHVKVGEGSGEGVLRAELSFSDEDGRVWLEVGEIELRRAPRSALERAAGDPVSGWLYGLEWREQALEDSAVTESEPGGWLVLDDGGDVGAQLSSRLAEAGDRVMRVRPGDGASDTCDPLDREGLGKRLEALCGGANGEGRVSLRGVVHLWGLDGGDPGPEEVSAEAIESALQVSGGGLMTVVQALARREEGEAPRLYLVTRGAQSVGMPPSRLDLSAAPLWGLARTVALEHPALRPVRIDLDPGEESPESLWREVRSVGDEDQVALRGGKRYVARLGRAAVPTSSPDEPVSGGPQSSAIREDALYLVTGGLGGLGLEVARWLVERGARHLALVSRRPPNETAKASLEALERAGARVRVGQVDLSDPEAVGHFLAEARADGSPPLRGILHAAGVIDDGVLAQQDWPRFERVLAPKLRGALALVDHTRDQEIDFLVLFSSVASLLGSPGQGNYAMANAFLDALAHDLQARGGTALSINWGPWSRVGMAAGLDEADRRRRAAQGVDLLEPEEGCRALERLLDSGLVQCAVMPVDWSRFQRTLPEGAGRLFYEELATTAGEGPAPQEKAHHELRRRLEAAPPRQRQQIVHEHVRQQVTRALGLDPDHSPGAREDLTALGMDSLMAVELKNRLEATLGVSMPVAALLDEATVEALARTLLERLGAAAPTPASLADRIDARDDDEHEPLRREGLAAHGPLSSIQRRLWFFHRFEPDSATYNMSLRFEMTGALDTGVLQESLTALITRHEALRTRFEEEGGEPFATVVESSPLACPIDDLRGMGEGAEVELERLLKQDEGQPFDLRHAPLLRARLVQMDDARSVLGLTMHHIASDGWSMGVLATDFLAVYESISRGEEPSPGALPFRYRDHVAAERRWLGSPVAERQLEYWRGRLSGALPVVDLPRDYSRPRVQTYRGGTRAHRLSERLTRRVAELSRAQGVTPFMTLLSAFALLLHRLTGLEDLPIGVPVAGRGRPETDGIVGVFINTVVMRHDLSAAPAFAELLARSRKLALEAYDNAEVPFDRVVEAVQPRRDPARSPLFQVLFNSIDFGGRRRAELPALTVDVSAADSGDSKFDLTLYVGPSEEGTGLMLSFNSDLYRPERMEGLLAQYEFVLEQAVSHPERPVSQISLLAESTRAVLPDPARPLEPWTGPTLTEPFLRHARRNPDRGAVVDVDGTLDYGAMERLSAGLAGRLGAAGVSRGDVVALFCPRSRELVWGMLGVLRAGAGFVVLDPDHPPARVLECLRVSKASAWLASPRLGAPDPALGEALDGRQWALRAELGLALLAGEAPRPDDGDAKPDDMAYVAFTSGTLGGVKGILGTHGPPAHFLSWQSRTFDLNADDRFSLLSGLSHDPLLRDVFAPLHAGATLCVPDPDVVLMPSELRRWLADEAVTVVHLTPSLAGVLADGAEAGVLPGLRYAFLGGEVLTHGVVDALRRLAPSVTVVNFYGATETPQAVGWHGVPSKEDEGEGSSSIPIGQGIDDVQLLVLDQEGGLAGIGELGEIGVRTPHLARGYVDDEALTRERFISSPFAQDPGDRIYRTGDLGRYRTDGLVEYAGRRDGQVKIRGYRVEPGAIQQLLHDHPGVRQACVLAVAGDEAAGAGGEVRLVAYLVLDPAEPPTVTDLRRHLRAHVPDYMVPSLFVTLDALPLTPNGKVDRSRLETSSVSSLRSEEVRQPPRTEAERFVAEVWKETLEIESVDVGDNFFDLGGHSLQAIRVLARIEEQTGQRINPRLMIYQTLERFAAGLDVGPLADSSAARGGRGPLRRLWAAISGLRPRAQPESS